MFEKEAITHAFEATIGIECLNKPIEDFTYEDLSDEQQEKAYDFKKGAEFGYNKANEQLTLPKDILGLWEQTVCEIRSEIKSWDLKGPHISDYAKELCDKLEHSMCAVAGGPYSLRYSITD